MAAPAHSATVQSCLLASKLLFKGARSGAPVGAEEGGEELGAVHEVHVQRIRAVRVVARAQLGVAQHLSGYHTQHLISHTTSSGAPAFTEFP